MSGVARMAVILCVMAAGCASSTRGQKMVEGFQDTQVAIVQAQGKVEATLASLGHLRYTGAIASLGGAGGGGAIDDAFSMYKKSVEGLEKEGQSARRRAEALRENVDANIQAWQAEMKAIDNPAIKASLENRRDAVRSNYKLVRMYADDARKAYEPFLRDNKDIVRALSIDLSPAALNGLKPAIDGAIAKGQVLQQRLAAMQHALGNIERGVAPIGDLSAAPPPAPPPE